MFTPQQKYFFIVIMITTLSTNISSSSSSSYASHNKDSKSQITDTKLIRKSRSPDPRAFLEPIFKIKQIHREQKNDTDQTLRGVYNIIADSFSDTATTTTTLRPLIENNVNENDTVSTTTEKYRVSRAELGKILRRNVLGLQRLLQLELNDAFNQSTYTIAEYKASQKSKFG